MENKTKILSLAFQKMPNGTHNVFMHLVNDLLKDKNFPSAGYEALLESFNLALQAEDAAIGVRRKSELTAELVKLNIRREEIYSGLYHHYQSSLLHYDDEVREAAKRMEPIMISIAEMHSTSNIKRNGLIYKVTYNLRKQEDTVRILALSGWLDALDEANARFDQVTTKRFSEMVNKGNGNVLSTRKVTDEAYRAIVVRVNAQIIFDGTETIETFVRRLNYLITKEKKRIAIRDGIRRHKKEKAKAKMDSQASESQTA
ncbi:DUF6261 family protein [Parabacteroides sp. FAFU027]|uniref:DUF6261 family protein n=1 Tax=Parabacteroides sp. FAFU027 TaxID=2922715 RepID=UPI001FAEC87B|nr:DUF6261 family protein [Parabacteroides sp. FAFU027]